MPDLAIALLVAAGLVYLYTIISKQTVGKNNAANNLVFVITGCTYITADNDNGSLTMFSPKMTNSIIIDLMAGPPTKKFFISVVGDKLTIHQDREYITMPKKYDALFNVNLNEGNVTVSGLHYDNTSIKCILNWVIVPRGMTKSVK